MIRPLLSWLDRRIDARADARIAAVKKDEIDAKWTRLQENLRLPEGSYERVMAESLFDVFPERRRSE